VKKRRAVQGKKCNEKTSCLPAECRERGEFDLSRAKPVHLLWHCNRAKERASILPSQNKIDTRIPEVLIQRRSSWILIAKSGEGWILEKRDAVGSFVRIHILSQREGKLEIPIFAYPSLPCSRAGQINVILGSISWGITQLPAFARIVTMIFKWPIND
jgi:hypothetical protein